MIINSNYLINLVTCTYAKNTYCSNKIDLPEIRKNHVAVNVGQHMLVHGGLDEKDHVINDAHILSYKDMHWQKLYVRNSANPYLAYHSAVAVISEKKLEQQGFHIYEYNNYKSPNKMVLICYIIKY